eukprot:1016183-Amphidinium_carterae.4
MQSNWCTPCRLHTLVKDRHAIVDPLGACQPYTMEMIVTVRAGSQTQNVPEGALTDLAAVSTGVHERQRSDMLDIAHAVEELASLAHLPTELEVVQSRSQSPTAKIDSRSHAIEAKLREVAKAQNSNKTT